MDCAAAFRRLRAETDAGKTPPIPLGRAFRLRPNRRTMHPEQAFPAPGRAARVHAAACGSAWIDRSRAARADVASPQGLWHWGRALDDAAARLRCHRAAGVRIVDAGGRRIGAGRPGDAAGAVLHRSAFRRRCGPDSLKPLLRYRFPRPKVRGPGRHPRRPAAGLEAVRRKVRRAGLLAARRASAGRSVVRPVPRVRRHVRKVGVDAAAGRRDGVPADPLPSVRDRGLRSRFAAGMDLDLPARKVATTQRSPRQARRHKAIRSKWISSRNHSCSDRMSENRTNNRRSSPTFSQRQRKFEATPTRHNCPAGGIGMVNEKAPANSTGRHAKECAKAGSDGPGRDGHYLMTLSGIGSPSCIAARLRSTAKRMSVVIAWTEPSTKQNCTTPGCRLLN